MIPRDSPPLSQENGQLSERQAIEHFDRLFETLQERKTEMLRSIDQSRNRRLDQLKGQVCSPTGSRWRISHHSMGGVEWRACVYIYITVTDAKDYMLPDHYTTPLITAPLLSPIRVWKTEGT